MVGHGTNEGKAALYHCNYCHKDISGKIRTKCVVCPDFDLCIECFSVGAEATPHVCFHPYRVMVGSVIYILVFYAISVLFMLQDMVFDGYYLLCFMAWFFFFHFSLVHVKIFILMQLDHCLSDTGS